MAAVEGVDRFRRRGSVVLLIVAVVQIVGFVVVLAAPATAQVRSPLLAWLAMSVAFLVWVARGLTLGEEWARPVAIVALWLVAITGVVDTLVAVAENRIHLPLGTLIAAYALAAPAGPFRLPEAGTAHQKAIVGCVGAVLLFVIPPILNVVAAR